MATTRPRGFMENWNPKETTLDLIGKVKEILENNAAIVPLTLRQIFYILVSNYDFEKTEQAYQRLCETLNKARRAMLVPMDVIRDDGFREINSAGWDDVDQWARSIKRRAENFKLDRQEGQEVRLMIWCEAQGMAPQLASAARKYQVPVVSSGGFDSVTTKHDMAERLAGLGNVEILHIGDHDPSGVHICSSLDEDLQAFVGHYGGKIAVTRLAVTPEQVKEMNLSTAPPKRTDKRRFEGLTTQAEAIPPATLREIVIDAIEQLIDFNAFDDVMEREGKAREEAIERAERI